MVVGAGAVGSWLGGALAGGGADVMMVEPGPRRAVVAEQGLILTAGDRTMRVRPAVAASIGAALGGARFDLALVAVKSYHTADVAAELGDARAPHRVTSFQNGLGNDDVLIAALPGRTLIPATLTTGLYVDESGAVRAAAKGGVGLGAAKGGSDIADLAGALATGGLIVRHYDDPSAMKWSKLLLNLLGSATSAILAWPPTRVFADRRLFDVERAAWLEAVAVMRARGLAPVALPGYPVPLYVRALSLFPPGLAFHFFARRLAGARGDRLPGVAADLAAGRSQTENSVLTGAVVAAGEAIGVPVPVNRALAALVDAIAARRVDRDAYAGRPEALIATVVPRTTGAPTRRGA
jgi:2-dehydropantoate 2-reductase